LHPAVPPILVQHPLTPHKNAAAKDNGFAPVGNYLQKLSSALISPFTENTASHSHQRRLSEPMSLRLLLLITGLYSVLYTHIPPLSRVFLLFLRKTYEKKIRPERPYDAEADLLLSQTKIIQNRIRRSSRGGNLSPRAYPLPTEKRQR